MRLFTAIPIPEEVKEQIVLETASLRGKYPQLKWLGQDAYHITFNFLGEQGPEAVDALRSAFDRVIPDFPSFHITFEGIGTFPPRGAARVVYLAMNEGSKECRALHMQLSKLLEGTFSLEKRRFTPHLTLARNKKRSPWPDPRTEGEGIRSGFAARRMVLFKSTLRPAGPVYEEIYSRELGTREG